MADVYIPEGNPAIPTVADGDTLIAERGNQTITSGTDLSGVTEGLALAIFRKTAAIVFTPDAPLKADFDYSAGSMLVNEMLAGRLYYWPGGDNLLCNRLKHLNSSETHVISGGTVTRFEQRAGRTRIARAVTLTNLYLLGGACQVQYKSSAFTGGKISGGNHNINRAFSGTLRISGGNVVVQREELTDTPPTGGTLEVMGAGTRVKWKGGNITNLIGEGAAGIDFSEITGNITVTNSTVDDTFMRNSVWKSPNGTVTIANTLAVYGSETDTIPV